MEKAAPPTPPPSAPPDGPDFRGGAGVPARTSCGERGERDPRTRGPRAGEEAANPAREGPSLHSPWRGLRAREHCGSRGELR